MDNVEIVEVAKDSITIRWSENKFVKNYIVEARDKSTGVSETFTVKSGDDNFASHTLGNLKPDVEYSISVRASPVGSKATVVTAVTNPG